MEECSMKGRGETLLGRERHEIHTFDVFIGMLE